MEEGIPTGFLFRRRQEQERGWFDCG